MEHDERDDTFRLDIPVEFDHGPGGMRCGDCGADLRVGEEVCVHFREPGERTVIFRSRFLLPGMPPGDWHELTASVDVRRKDEADGEPVQELRVGDIFREDGNGTEPPVGPATDPER